MNIVIKNLAIPSYAFKMKSKMTFIIAGIKNNESFLMADTVENENTTYSQEKIYRSVTNKNLFLASQGDQQLMAIIQLYDDWLYKHNQEIVFDIKTVLLFAKKLEEVVCLFKWDITKGEKLSNNRIFVVNQNVVEYFDLLFTNNKLINVIHHIVPNDNFIICSNSGCSPINNFIDSFSFCENEIYDIYQNHVLNNKTNLTNLNPLAFDDYFINGFSFYSTLNGFSSYCKDVNQYINNAFKI